MSVDPPPDAVDDLVTRAGLDRSRPVRRCRWRHGFRSTGCGWTNGHRVIVKQAHAPFLGEARVLRRVARAGAPVPTLLAASRRAGTLSMLMQDLGPPDREPTDLDGVRAAAALHNATPHRAGASRLAAALTSARTDLRTLTRRGHHDQTADLLDLVAALARAGSARLVGEELPPYGLVHGELHPSSVHIGSLGWRLVDFATTFIGPQLLDLASWQGIRYGVDLDRARYQIAAYACRTGDPTVLVRRGGLPAEVWASGWHRVWAAHWHLHELARDRLDATTPSEWEVVRRQLRQAVRLLAP